MTHQVQGRVCRQLPVSSPTAARSCVVLPGSRQFECHPKLTVPCPALARDAVQWWGGGVQATKRLWSRLAARQGCPTGAACSSAWCSRTSSATICPSTSSTWWTAPVCGTMVGASQHISYIPSMLSGGCASCRHLLIFQSCAQNSRSYSVRS